MLFGERGWKGPASLWISCGVALRQKRGFGGAYGRLRDRRAEAARFGWYSKRSLLNTSQKGEEAIESIYCCKKWRDVIEMATALR